MAHDIIITITAGSETAGIRIPHETLTALDESSGSDDIRDMMLANLKSELTRRAQPRLAHEAIDIRQQAEAAYRAAMSNVNEMINEGLDKVSTTE